jgi:diguanylate cyclase (GGDEF)-like protein
VTGGAVGGGAATGLLGVGVHASVGRTGRAGRGIRVTTPLARGTTKIRGTTKSRGTTRTSTRRSAPSLHDPLPPSTALPVASFPNVIQHFIQVVPWWVWLAFGVAFVGAAAAGAAAWRWGRKARAQAEQVAEVRAAAMTDPLTGVLNRRGFGAAAQRELERAQRYGHSLALAFVDVRGLKTVNDTRGHQAGDLLLKRVAALLQESSRSHDLVGRIGGDELAVLLTEQGAAGMAAVVRRVQSQLPATRAALGFDHDWDLTIGMAVFPKDGNSLEALLDAADRRLYMQRGINLR